MKRTLTLLVATITTLSLSACQNTPVNPPMVDDAQQPAANAVDAQQPAANAADTQQPAANAVEAQQPAANAADTQQPAANAADTQQPAANEADRSQIAKLIIACSPCLASDDIKNCESDAQIQCDMEPLKKLAKSSTSVDEFFKKDYKLYEKNIEYLTVCEPLEDDPDNCHYEHAKTCVDDDIAQYLDEIISIHKNSDQLGNISDADKKLLSSLIDLSTLTERATPDIAMLKQALNDGANVAGQAHPRTSRRRP